MYLDGDADLATPDTTSSGLLDAMGIAHLLGLADTELARLGVELPMLTDEQLALPVDDVDPFVLVGGIEEVTGEETGLGPGSALASG